MLLMLYLYVAADLSGVTMFTETEIYADTIERDEIAIGDQGQVYVVNPDDNQIIHYGADGTEIARIGSKGKGPGEFEFLSDLFFQNGKLYAFDMMNDRVTIFEANGRLIKEVRTQGRALRLAKAENGWVAASLFSMNPDNPPKVFWFDDQFENKSTLLELPNSGQEMIRINSSNGSKVKFNPVKDRTIMAGHPGHRYVYLKHPGDFRISVIDGQTGEVVREIKRNEKMVLFNEAYGNKAVERMNRKADSGPIKLQFEGDFPKHFPVVRDMIVNGDGLLVIRKWTERPDEREALLVLDAQDRDAKLGYPDDLYTRVVAERGGDVYLTASGEDEEVILIRCPRSEAVKVAKAYPLQSGEDEANVMFKVQ